MVGTPFLVQYSSNRFRVPLAAARGAQMEPVELAGNGPERFAAILHLAHKGENFRRRRRTAVDLCRALSSLF